MEDRIRTRLGQLSAYLGDADWLDGAFSAGDLLMVSVLLRLRASSDMLEVYPNVVSFVSRAEARPAYRRAFEAQLADFTASSTYLGSFLIKLSSGYPMSSIARSPPGRMSGFY